MDGAGGVTASLHCNTKMCDVEGVLPKSKVF
jgi:hypothetical protein